MKPLTRKEMLLDGAAKGNLDTFKPATREEVFAKRALANAGGSGGMTIYFIHSGDNYLYADADCTVKVTGAELREKYKTSVIGLYCENEYQSFVKYPAYINTVYEDEYMEVRYWDSDHLVIVYTAEWTEDSGPK